MSLERRIEAPEKSDALLVGESFEESQLQLADQGFVCVGSKNTPLS
jgi:hypothetical protein